MKNEYGAILPHNYFRIFLPTPGLHIRVFSKVLVEFDEFIEFI